MSIESYKRNVDRKVAGPMLPVCFPAALEQISPRHEYGPAIYKNYRDFIYWYNSFPVREKANLLSQYEDEVNNLVKPLGRLTLNDLIFSRVTSAIGLLRTVRPLLSEGWRVVVDIRVRDSRRDAHTVGLLPSNSDTDRVTLVSTHVPKCLDGVVELREIAEHLFVPEKMYVSGDHLLSNTNLIALPPDSQV